MANYTLKATRWNGETLAREFDSFDKAYEAYISIAENRDSIRLYKAVEVNNARHYFMLWWGTAEDEAREFYSTCHSIWHDGCVSEELIAERLNYPVGKVSLLCDACIAWKLPISKANGLWVF